MSVKSAPPVDLSRTRRPDPENFWLGIRKFYLIKFIFIIHLLFIKKWDLFILLLSAVRRVVPRYSGRGLDF